MTTYGISNKMKVAASLNVKERDYWLNQLSGDLVKSVFPYDHKPGNGNIKPYSPAALTFQFSPQINTKLIRLSNNSETRLHMILTAGLAVLLDKYTGNRDIILGMPIYKQEIKGSFINTVLALRNKPAPQMTFKELLLQVRQTIFDAVEHQNYPNEALLYKLNMSSSPGNDYPLFDVALLLENIHDKNHLDQIKNNMTISFLHTGENIEGKCEYNSSLYERATTERIISHFQQLFLAVMANLNIRLKDIEILSQQEQRHILYEFNRTEADYPGDKTIHELFRERVKKIPDRIALVYTDQYITYRELNERANRLAWLLRGKGVLPDGIVALLLEPSLEMIIGILGIIKAGAAYLPIAPEYPAQRITVILKASAVSILLTKEDIRSRAAFTSMRNITASEVTPLVTPARGQIKDFDGLPFPDRTLIDYEKYHRYIGIAMAKQTISLQATRGCPYNCGFCHKIWPKNHVARSAENIFEEILNCYQAGARRFVFVDDVFNLRRENMSGLMQKIIRQGLDIQLFFPNGLRGDILTPQLIDLMMEAGTVNIDLALESASPRIQKLIKKNLNLETFKENLNYITRAYPGLLLEMELMIGFPTETEEEVRMTLDFLKEMKWIHFPNLNILKIYPNTDMYKLAIESGIPREKIERSTSLAYHQLPETLPFSKSFTGQVQMQFMNEYFLSKERLVQVLPHQVQVLTEDELIQKYDSYLPMKINRFSDILEVGGISREELGNPGFLPGDHMAAAGFKEKIKTYFPVKEKDSNALRVLLMDLSQLFSSESANMLYDMIEEPLGLTYLLTYLNKTFTGKVHGKIAKSRIDFDNYSQLKTLLRDFKPDLIGIRTLSYYKEFFHKTVSLIRQWNIDVPVIAGGPYATSDYRRMLLDPLVDAAVLGEGEYTFAQLIEKILDNHKKMPDQEILKEIPGLAFIENQDKSFLQNSGRDIIFLGPLSGTIAQYPVKNPDNVNQPDNLLYLISTSGSTGIPKSLMIEHRNLTNLLNYEFFQTSIHFQRVLQFASIGFDVSAQEIFSTLLSGGELYLVPGEMKRDIFPLFDMIRKNYLNVVFWPPAFLKFIFSQSDYRAVFPLSIRHIITAGEQLLVSEPLRVFLQQHHVYLHNHYGPAETHVVTNFTMDPGNDIPEIPPIGKPICNTRIYILDEDKKAIPIGAVGELYISGANVGRGYHKRKELTAERFTPNPYLPGERMYRTGDLARWLPDGNIEFIGRVDHQVKIRAFRIELGEIESHLMTVDFIKEAVVVANKAPGDEKYLCAYIVAEKEVDISELRDLLLNDMPDYMIPSYFVQVEKIPLTSNGKVDRKALPKPEISTDESAAYIAPKNEVEKAMADIWAEVLGIEKTSISTDADFFQVGGHSLKATILTTQIHKTFDVKVSLGEMFEQPTIRGLSRLVKQARPEIFTAVRSIEKKEYYPLSSAQKRLYILQRLKFDNLSYNNPAMMELEGKLNREKLEETIRELIRRHESLRTFFELAGQEPVQRIHGEVEFEIQYYEAAQFEEREKTVHSFIRPFDLTHAPLLRVVLINKGEDRFILFYDMHHIITDGTSLTVFAKEFMAVYGGDGDVLPPLRIQYKDFSGWQNKSFESKEIKKQEEYWLEQLKGDVPPLDIPLDYPRPGIKSFEGSSIRFVISSEEVQGLQVLAKEVNATLYMVLLAIWNVLLAKLSGREDIIIGTPVAGRRHAHLHHIIGMFVNTLVIRNYPAGSKTFREFLQEVKDRTLAAFENQDYPFEQLVEQVQVNRDTSRNPIFDVMFALLNVTFPQIQVSGLKFKPYEFESKVAKFDLTLNGIEVEDHLVFYLEYSSKLFETASIERLSRFFNRIISRAKQIPHLRLNQVEIMTGEEKRQVLFDFNDTVCQYPEEKTIHELFAEQLELNPDRTALVGQIPGTCGENISITYRELDKCSGQLAHQLKQKGIQTDTIVGMLTGRSPGMVTGILGILKAGGAYLPIDPQYPAGRIDYMLVDSNVKILVTSDSLKREAETLRNWKGEILPDRGFDHSCPGEKTGKNQQLKTSPGNLAYVIYTSGSTGRPRGVPIRHHGFVNLIYHHQQVFAGDSRSHMSQVASPGFDAMAFEVWPCLLNGAQLHIASSEITMDPVKMQEWLISRNITISFQPTPMAERLLNLDWPRQGAALKALRTAGDRLTIFPLKQYPFRLYNLYGPTEDTVWTTWTEIKPRQKKGVSSLPPIGKPIANHQVYIMGSGFQFQPIGAAGELCIAGAGLARGYLNNPELTAEKFVLAPNPRQHKDVNFSWSLETRVDKLYRSGDLARWLWDGNIDFIGRIDLQVKIRGFRLEPGEIEAQLSRHDLIKEAVVSTKTDEKGETYLCAYIVSKEKPDMDTLYDYLSKYLPAHMIPSYFVPLDKIPVTPNGKIDRKALPVPVMVKRDGNIPPGNETEKKLVNIWAEVLNLEQQVIGINSNFFRLGGHSLKATLVVSKIYKDFQVKIPLVDLFKMPTVEGLARCITGMKREHYTHIACAEKKEYYMLTPAQKSMYVIWQLQPGSEAYNMPVAFEVHGEIDPGKAALAFKNLIARHEILRTSFLLVNGEPVQRVQDKVAFDLSTPLSTKSRADLISSFIRPFDLSRAPLLRAGIIPGGPGAYIIIIDMHHIVTDGISLEIFTREFMALYNRQQLPALSIHYKDFSVWMNRLEESGMLKEQEKYWLTQLDNEIPVLNLPLDFDRPELQSFRGSMVYFSIDRETTEKLNLLKSEEDVTLFMILLAVYNILLAKLCHQEDLIIGTPVIGRRHPALESVMGMFVNTLPLRNFPGKEKTFIEFLLEVKERSLDAFENQDYYFKNLVSKLTVTHDASRNPLFDVVLSLHSHSLPSVEIPDLQIKPLDLETKISHFDLLLHATEMKDTIALAWEYTVALFKPSTIRKMAGYFPDILHQVLKDRNIKLKEVSISHDMLTASANILETRESAYDF